MNDIQTALLIDFGSTYTKVTAVDISGAMLIGSASAYTTASSDVGEGLSLALAELEKQTGQTGYGKRLACSSAAGGLRMAACGLAPELTAKAASLAALGAGAKITGIYSYELIEEDIEKINASSPDILLLTGGTDGGNKKCILHNAEMLAGAAGDYPIIVAGNRNCGREVMRILAARRAYLCDNVMPRVDELNIEPARQLIRDIFLERIVSAKGLTQAADLRGGIIMPTPAAVLSAAEMLAKDMGELIVIDVGGATTDVYSIAEGSPRGTNTICKGLPEPFAKRTVEGDIGMRYSVCGIVEAAGISRVAELAGLLEADTAERVKQLSRNTGSLPQTAEDKSLDFALASLAIETASIRHAGSLEEVYTAFGLSYAQTGKDLTRVGNTILTGGALLNAGRQAELGVYAFYNEMHPQSLRPKKSKLLIDSHYILAAMGLLGEYEPTAALGILKTNLGA